MTRLASATALILIWGLFLHGTAAEATIIPPIGLAQGAQYQLVFVTKGTIQATSTTEAPYNQFANDEAAQNPLLPATTWHAVTSTADGTAANTNAPWLGLPVYNTQGILVSTVAQGFYNLGTFPHTATIRYDQFGDPSLSLLWTGSTSLGGQDPTRSMGSSLVIFGNAGQIAQQWINSSIGSSSLVFRPIYALSGALTVPAPEPSSIILFVAGIAVLAGARWRQGRTR